MNADQTDILRKDADKTDFYFLKSTNFQFFNSV